MKRMSIKNFGRNECIKIINNIILEIQDLIKMFGDPMYIKRFVNPYLKYKYDSF